MWPIKKFDLKKFLYDNQYFLLFLLINIVAHWKLLLLDTQLAYGDLHPWPETIPQALNNFLFSWDEVGFGLSRQSGNPKSLIMAVFLLFTRSPLLAQKLYIFLLPFLSFVGFDRLLKRHLEIKNGSSRFLASTFYTFCPVALGEFVGGSHYSTLLVFSLLPFLFSLTLDMIKKSNLKLIFVEGLILGVVFSIYVQFVAMFFLVFISFFIFDLITTKLKSFNSWLRLSLVGVIAALVNPIAFLTSMGILVNRNIGQETRSFLDYTHQFLMEMSITYEKNPLSVIFRLGSVGAYDYRQHHFWSIPFFIIVLLTLFITIYLLIKKRANKLVVVSLFNFLFISFFIFCTAKEWTFPIFRAVPVLFMFRNPAKLTYISTFFFSLMLAYSLDHLFSIKIKQTAKHLLVFTLAAIIFLYLWPILLGDRGLSYQRERFVIPPHYRQTVKTLKRLREDSTARTAWIPIGHEATFIKLLWLDNSKLDAQIGLQEFGGSAFEHKVLESVYFAFFRQDQEAALNALRMAQVDYLVLFKDDYFYYNTILNKELIYKTLEGVPIIESNEYFDIFQIGTKFPLIFSPKTIYTANILDSYYSLSKIDTEGAFALIPVHNARQLQIDPDKFLMFVSYDDPAVLTSNVVWNDTWSWEKPNIFPKKPPPLTPETSVYSYTIDSLESLADTTTYLTSNGRLEGQEKERLIETYKDILNFFNIFTSNIPQDKVNYDILGLIRRVYLYVDRSYLELSRAGLVDQSITSQYESFVENVNKYNSEKCGFDFCYQVGILSPDEYVVEVFDVERPNQNGALIIDDTKHDFQGYTDNNWISAGKVSFKEGDHYIGLDLEQEQKDYIFDEEKNTITIFNDEDIKYNLTFLHNFKNDVFLDIYNIPEDDTELTDKYLVWKGHLASSDSDNFCYVKENGKCYRFFVANLQPNNNYKSIRVTFYQDVSGHENAANVVKDVSVTKQINPALSLELPSEQPDRAVPDVTYQKLSPAKYKVFIKNISEDFLLMFNQSFNNNWTLQTEDKQILSANDHFRSNYFANTWYVRRSDLDGEEVTLEIVFEPQKAQNISLVISIATVSICLYFIFRKEP